MRIRIGWLDRHGRVIVRVVAVSGFACAAGIALKLATPSAVAASTNGTATASHSAPAIAVQRAMTARLLSLPRARRAAPPSGPPLRPATLAVAVGSGATLPAAIRPPAAGPVRTTGGRPLPPAPVAPPSAHRPDAPAPRSPAPAHRTGRGHGTAPAAPEPAGRLATLIRLDAQLTELAGRVAALAARADDRLLDPTTQARPFGGPAAGLAAPGGEATTATANQAEKPAASPQGAAPAVAAAAPPAAGQLPSTLLGQPLPATAEAQSAGPPQGTTRRAAAARTRHPATAPAIGPRQQHPAAGPAEAPPAALQPLPPPAPPAAHGPATSGGQGGGTARPGPVGPTPAAPQPAPSRTSGSDFSPDMPIAALITVLILVAVLSQLHRLRRRRMRRVLAAAAAERAAAQAVLESPIAYLPATRRVRRR